MLSGHSSVLKLYTCIFRPVQLVVLATETYLQSDDLEKYVRKYKSLLRGELTLVEG